MRNLKWALPLLLVFVTGAICAQDAKGDKKSPPVVGTLDKAPDGKADIAATLKNAKGDVYNLIASTDDIKKKLTDLQGKKVKVTGSGDKDKYTVTAVDEIKDKPKK
jgi:hypothetical protein